MRQTKHREAILDTVKNAKTAVSAHDVSVALPHINLATIYRNLEAFVKDGTLTKLHLTGDEARFEYQQHPHHHAVCDYCENVIHFHIDEKLLSQALNIPAFAVKHVELVVHGECASNKHQRDLQQQK